MIPQTFVQDLLNRLDIVDVIEGCIPLKKAGANHVACCPFHNEKSPSFTVSQSKQFYHCFGCGVHGTAIGFIMEYMGLGFVDAVKDLAGRVGMKVPEFKADNKQEIGRAVREMSEIMQNAAQYYKNQLKKSTQAIDYLKRRGVSGDIAARFEMGFAPSGWQNLSGVFPKYEDTVLGELGLVIANDQGKRYDRFRERIMFPIHSSRGDIVGFGGRVLENGEPKYLNSPETPLFEKGRELYGLFQARHAIRSSGKVIVVEGYMDVVALAQHGIDYVVATLGTATTPMHVHKLLGQSDTVIFCFDGDDAGERAAWRALENSLAQLADGKTISFMFLPKGEDPDSLVRKIGKQAFDQLLINALPLSDFLLRKLSAQVNLATHEGKAKLLKDAQSLIKKISAPNLSRLIRKSLAEVCGVTEQELSSAFQIKVASSPSTRRTQKPRFSLYRKALESVIFSPNLAIHCAALVISDDNGLEAQALKLLLQLLQENSNVSTTAGVIQLFSGSPYSSLIGEVEREILELGESFDFEKHLDHALAQLTEIDEKRTAKAVLSTHLSPKDFSPEEREKIRYGGRVPALAEK